MMHQWRTLLCYLALGSCSGQPLTNTIDPCRTLFGSPTNNTGLNAKSCQPQRLCQNLPDFTPPDYNNADLDRLRSYTLKNPPAPLNANPYKNPSLIPTNINAVCAVLQENHTEYRLKTFPNTQKALAASAYITHTNACGSCSSLQDLAVYIEQKDLASSARFCALKRLSGGRKNGLSCLENLGFTTACAQIWNFNAQNTQASCLLKCLITLRKPYHLPDGRLNSCLACDENKSGPVFKAVAGRTRRNSGLPSAICRPGNSVSAILHSSTNLPLQLPKYHKYP